MSPRINPAVGDHSPVLTAASSRPGIRAGNRVDQNSPVSPPLENTSPSRLADRSASSPSVEESALTVPSIQLPGRFIQDVQRVADRTGYVGLSASAIQRAYLQGESLFVDVSA